MVFYKRLVVTRATLGSRPVGRHSPLVSLPVLSFQSANASYRPFDVFGILTSGCPLYFFRKDRHNCAPLLDSSLCIRETPALWGTQASRHGPGEFDLIPGTPGSRDRPGERSLFLGVFPPGSRDRPGEQSFFLGVFPRDYFLIPGDFDFIPGDIPGEFSIPGDFVTAP